MNLGGLHSTSRENSHLSPSFSTKDSYHDKTLQHAVRCCRGGPLFPAGEAVKRAQKKEGGV